MMQRLLIVSDNHGDVETLDRILAVEEYDISIHLGDSEMQQNQINNKFDYAVSGNNDWFNQESFIFDVEGLKIGAIHGHTIGVSAMNWINPSLKYAQKNNLDILLFGHIHVPYHKEVEGKLLLCPGSTSWPRMNSVASYVVMIIDNGKINSIDIKNIST